jgi:hypothetical protein
VAVCGKCGKPNHHGLKCKNAPLQNAVHLGDIEDQRDLLFRMNAKATPGTIFTANDVNLARDGPKTARNRRKKAKKRRRLANARERDRDTAEAEAQPGSASEVAATSVAGEEPLDQKDLPLRLRAPLPEEDDDEDLDEADWNSSD